LSVAQTYSASQSGAREQQVQPGKYHDRICYQGGALLVLPDRVNAKNFPESAMKIEAFASTVAQL
jgi:hypothetical protein